MFFSINCTIQPIFRMLKTITFLFSSNFLLFVILLHVICKDNMIFQKCQDIFAASNNAFNKIFSLSKNDSLSLILAPKPECTIDPECPTQLACINEKCKNPCYSHTCGRNAECTVKNHRPICVCLAGFVGNPQTICEERK